MTTLPAEPDRAPSVHDVLAPGETEERTRKDGRREDDGAQAALVDAACSVSKAILAPAAEITDEAAVVPQSHIDALAAAGLQGLMGPTHAGGANAPPPVVRDVFEALAGACGVTFFVWVQHHAPVRLLAGSANSALRDKYLPALCRGDVLGGVAFAYLRRPGPAAVVARRVRGGYQIDGEAPWVTSWGLAGVYAVAASVGPHSEPSGEIVYFCLPGVGSEHVRPSSPLALSVMNASATVRLRFAGLFVPNADVISSVSRREWEARDRVGTARPNPAAFGIASTCVAKLSETRSTDAAAALSDELVRCREHSYGLADAGFNAGTDAADRLARLVDARAWSLDLAVRSAEALVVATGGRAMGLGHPAQRLLREAAFFTIQAQTSELREATLRRLTR